MPGALDLDGPSSIDLLKFFNARAPEVRALVGESPSVKVARHMRRRATSHTSRKWPLQQRLQQHEKKRGKGAKDTENNDGEMTLQSRRVRRRPANMMRLASRTERPHALLETHLWHAKRMVMTNIWGLSLAEAPTDHCKSSRFAHGSAKKACNLHDGSYVQALELCGSAQQLCVLLERFGVDALPRRARYLNGSCEGTLLLHQPSSGVGTEGKSECGSLICPAVFHWQPKEEPTLLDSRCLRLWLHVSVYDYVTSLLTREAGAAVVVDTAVRHELLRFEVTGAHSTGVVASILRSCPSAGADTTAARVLPLLAGLPSPPNVGLIPYGLVLALQVQAPNTLKGVCSAVPGGGRKSKDERISEEGTVEMMIKTSSGRSEGSKGLTAIKALVAGSRGALARSPLASSQGWRKCVRPKINSVSDSSALANDKEGIEVLLVYRGGGCRGGGTGWGRASSGWSIVLPRGWGADMFVQLIYAGGRAIGLRDARELRAADGLASFPEDFPDTAAGRMYEKHTAACAAAAASTRSKGHQKGSASLDWDRILGLTGGIAQVESAVVVAEPLSEAVGAELGAGEEKCAGKKRGRKTVSAVEVGAGGRPTKRLRHELEAVSPLGVVTESVSAPAFRVIRDANPSGAREVAQRLTSPELHPSLWQIGISALGAGHVSAGAALYAPSPEQYERWIMHPDENNVSATELGSAIGYATIGLPGDVAGRGIGLAFCTTTALGNLLVTQLTARDLSLETAAHTRKPRLAIWVWLVNVSSTRAQAYALDLTGHATCLGTNGRGAV
jgi:hypothetical protein